MRVVFDNDGRVDHVYVTFHAVSDREASGLQAGAANPQHALEAFASGDILFRQMKFDDAMKRYDEAIQENSS